MESSLAVILATVLVCCHVTARPWNLGPSRSQQSWAAESYRLPSRGYSNSYGDSSMRMPAENRYENGAPSSQDSQLDWYPSEPAYKDPYFDDGGEDLFMDDPESDVDAWGDVNIDELYDALSEWIEEKEADEANIVVKEDMMEEPSHYTRSPSLIGSIDADRDEDFEEVVDKLFKVSSENKFPRRLQLQMGIRDLTIDNNDGTDEIEENEDQGDGEMDQSAAVVDRNDAVGNMESKKDSSSENGIGLTKGLTLEKAHTLLEQLKKAEEEKTSTHHDYEQVNKQSIDNLLRGDKRSMEKASTTPKPEAIETTPSLSGGDDVENNKTPNTDDALKLKTQLLQEENDMLIEALDSFADLPLEYFQKVEDIQRLKTLIERAALRQDAVEFIDANLS